MNNFAYHLFYNTRKNVKFAVLFALFAIKKVTYNKQL